jgi:hypothetical protein
MGLLGSYNQQGFSVPHFYDPQGNRIEITRDNILIGRNTSGGTLTKGNAVYVTGSTGTVPTFSAALANSSTTMPALGLLYEDATNNSYARIMVIGDLESYNASAFTAGDLLYVSPTSAGALTNVKPANFAQNVAIVLNNGVGNGVLQVFTRVVQGFNYGDLVSSCNSPTSAQVVATNSTAIIVGDYQPTGNTTLQAGSKVIQIPVSNLTIPATIFTPQNNLCINGGFDFMQRGTPSGTAVTYAGPNAADTYTFDRKKANNQTGLSGWTVARNSAGGPLNENWASWIQSARADKLLIYEMIEGLSGSVLAAQGLPIIFQTYIRMPAGPVNVNMAVLQWQASVDGMSTGITSAWGSGAGSDPNFIGYNVLGKRTFLATSSWQQIYTIVYPSIIGTNLVPVIWLDSQTTSSGELDVAEWGLYYGSTLQPWIPRLKGQELALCQRYYEKSFSVNVAPAQNTNDFTGALGTLSGGAWSAAATAYFKVEKRAIPTFTTYNPHQANANWRNNSDTIDGTAVVIRTGTTSATIVQNTATAASYLIHWSAEADF